MSQTAKPLDYVNRIGLNFMRPDVNRPGNYDFINNGEWLVSQYQQLGVKWNRLAFSWVLIQPNKDSYHWDIYDRIVEASTRAKINLLATIGGHFDRPPVPGWAGQSLKEVIHKNPQALVNFIDACAHRYLPYIQSWEVLNEPSGFHKDLTVLEYVERILKPSYRIIKAINPNARILPCAYNQLPIKGNREDFWGAARGYVDIHNYHQYQHWGYFLTRTSAAEDEAELQRFRGEMVKNGEDAKPFWVTETGWWGTCSITGSMYDIYKRIPGELSIEIKPAYSGREILTHPVVYREDAYRAEWMKDLLPRALSIPGCEKVFLWTSMDEFENGYDPEKVYGSSTIGQPANQVDLWGIIAGDKSWRKSAFVLQDILRSSTEVILFEDQSK
jgi:hypothetical protein